MVTGILRKYDLFLVFSPSWALKRLKDPRNEVYLVPSTFSFPGNEIATRLKFYIGKLKAQVETFSALNWFKLLNCFKLLKLFHFISVNAPNWWRAKIFSSLNSARNSLLTLQLVTYAFCQWSRALVKASCRNGFTIGRKDDVNSLFMAGAAVTPTDLTPRQNVNFDA